MKSKHIAVHGYHMYICIYVERERHMPFETQIKACAAHIWSKDFELLSKGLIEQVYSKARPASTIRT